MVATLHADGGDQADPTGEIFSILPLRLQPQALPGIDRLEAKPPIHWKQRMVYRTPGVKHDW